MRNLVLLPLLIAATSCKHAPNKLPRATALINKPNVGDNWTFEINTDPSIPARQKSALKSRPESVQATQLTAPQAAAEALPSSFDWRIFGLSPVRDQGYLCGSCWTFAAASMTQDIISLFRHKIGPISTQYAMSCNTGGGSCINGGSAFDALNLYRDKGIVLESDYPYAEADLTCNSSVPYGETIKSWGWADPVAVSRNFGQDSVNSVKRAIFQYGPVTTSIKITTPWAYYKSGIFNACDAIAPGDTDHIVNIVGWDDPGQYWIIRNSWSSDWGEQGYMRIKWNCLNVGSATMFAVVDKLIKPQPLPPPDLTPPTCKVLTPANNYTVPAGMTILTAKIDARDNIAGVSSKVFVDGINVGSPTSGLVKIKLSGMKTGPHTIRCEVTDKAGNKGKSADVVIKVLRPI